MIDIKTVSTAGIIDTTESESVEFTRRFPCAAAASEVLGMAAMLRSTAAQLDSLVDNAPNYDPASLRRRAAGLVRALVAEIEGKVVL